MPFWIWWPGLFLSIGVVCFVGLWWYTTTIAAGTDGQTWRRVRVFVGHAVRVVAAAVVGLWVADGRHRAGREPSTYALVAGHRDRAAWAVSRERKPVPTVVPRPAPPTIGAVALAVHFPADTQEFDRVFGTEPTVALGAAA